MKEDVNVVLSVQWIQNTNTPCKQNTQTCGFRAGPQSNWLLTQLINRTVNGISLSEVNVMIEFELQNCDITLNCQRTFSTYIYETSIADNDVRRNISNYRQLRRVSPDITTGARVNETVVVNFQTNQPSFYFTVEDETSCIVITRMIVFYNVCPNQTIDLISAPEIIAPMSGVITVDATCASNAETEGDTDPKLVCSPEGTWTSLGSGCRCAPGSGFVNGSCSCELKLLMRLLDEVYMYASSNGIIHVYRLHAVIIKLQAPSLRSEPGLSTQN